MKENNKNSTMTGYSFPKKLTQIKKHVINESRSGWFPRFPGRTSDMSVRISYEEEPVPLRLPMSSSIYARGMRKEFYNFTTESSKLLHFVNRKYRYDLYVLNAITRPKREIGLWDNYLWRGPRWFHRKMYFGRYVQRLPRIEEVRYMGQWFWRNFRKDIRAHYARHIRSSERHVVPRIADHGDGFDYFDEEYLGYFRFNPKLFRPKPFKPMKLKAYRLKERARVEVYGHGAPFKYQRAFTYYDEAKYMFVHSDNLRFYAFDFNDIKLEKYFFRKALQSKDVNFSFLWETTDEHSWYI